MQNAQQLSQIECDAQLGAVFQARSIKLSSLSDRIANHLRLVEPLNLRYTVRYNVPAATPFLHISVQLDCAEDTLSGRLYHAALHG